MVEKSVSRRLVDRFAAAGSDVVVALVEWMMGNLWEGEKYDWDSSQRRKTACSVLESVATPRENNWYTRSQSTASIYHIYWKQPIKALSQGYWPATKLPTHSVVPMLASNLACEFKRYSDPGPTTE